MSVEEVEKVLPTFTDFLENQEEKTEEKIETEIIPLNEIVNEEEEGKCPYCPYKARKHAKDKQKSILNHIKKHHPDKLDNYSADNSITEEETTIKEVIDNVSCFKNEDELKIKLCEDLDLLKIKFGNTIDYNPTYNYPSTSLDLLKKYKGIYTRLIQEKISENTALNLLIMTARGVERVGKRFDIDLDGLGNDIEENENELMTEIKSCIDAQIIDVSTITPDVRLALLLSNIVVSRMERNSIKKNSENLRVSAPS